MADAELSILLQLKDDASMKLDAFEGKLEEMGTTLNKVSLAAVAMGGAIIASLGAMVSAAAQEAEGEGRLKIAIDNTGASYDSVKGKIDSLLTSQMANTNYSKNQQTNALANLVTVCGSVEGALAKLPLALDLAAAKQLDLTTASQYVGKVMEGEWASLNRLLPGIKDCTSASEALAFLQGKVGGAAEGTANPLTVMKNNLAEVASTIGSALLPVLQFIVDHVVPIIQKFGEWCEQNKALVGTFLVVVGAVGSVLIVLGTLGLVVPKIAEGIKICRLAWQALNLSFLTSPIGILIMLIIGFIILLVTQFDHLKAGFKVIWDFMVKGWNAIKDAFVTAWNFIKSVFETVFHAIYNTFATVINALMAGIEKFVNFFIDGINLVIRGINAISPFADIGMVANVELPRIEKLAEGGNVTAGGMAMVGERGPELLNLPKGASVTPLDKAAGNVTVNVTVQGSMLSNAAELAHIIREELLKTSRRLGGTATGNLGFT